MARLSKDVTKEIDALVAKAIQEASEAAAADYQKRMDRETPSDYATKHHNADDKASQHYYFMLSCKLMSSLETLLHGYPNGDCSGKKFDWMAHEQEWAQKIEVDYNTYKRAQAAQ